MRSATIGWTGHELNEFLSSDWRTRLITWMNADIGPDPLWLRGHGQAEAVGGDRTATTPTTTETSHELPDKDDNTTFTRHLPGASRQIDTTAPMGRTSAHSRAGRSVRRRKPVAPRVSRSGLLAYCAAGSATSSLARIAVAMRGLAYAGGARIDLSEATGHADDHCSFGGRGSPMILEIASACRDKSEMMTETCRMRALAVSKSGGASLSALVSAFGEQRELAARDDVGPTRRIFARINAVGDASVLRKHRRHDVAHVTGLR